MSVLTLSTNVESLNKKRNGLNNISTHISTVDLTIPEKLELAPLFMLCLSPKLNNNKHSDEDSRKL